MSAKNEKRQNRQVTSKEYKEMVAGAAIDLHVISLILQGFPRFL